MVETRLTFCRICEASCGLVAEVDGEQVTRLRPDADHVVSRGFACVKGTQYHEIHHSPDRLEAPLKRVGDQFVEISWRQAIDEIGQRVRALRSACGDDCIGFYAGNPTPFSPLNLIFSKAFATGLGTRHVYTSASLDCNNKFVASEEMFGSPMIQPLPDIDRSMGLIFIGANPVVSNMTFINAPRIRERLAAVTERGGFVAHLNPRRTESADLLGEHHFIRPGTDVFFLLAFARELLARREIPAHVDEACIGAADLRAAVEPWTPERTAQVTGVAPEALRDLVERYRTADGAAIYLSTGVNQGAHGTLCAWLAHAINLVSGHVDRPGGLMVTRQMVQAARVTYPHGKALAPRSTQIGGFRTVFDCEPVGLIPDEIEQPGAGRMRGLFVSAGNLALSAPNAARMQRALGSLELLVTIDLFRNETGQLADYVLPATSFLERDDLPLGITGYQPVPYLQYVKPVVRPLGEARDEWWIFTQLGRSCGAPLLGWRVVQWVASLAVGGAGGRSLRWRRFWSRMGLRMMALFNGRSLREVERHPHGLLLPAPKLGRFLKRGVLTGHGKVVLAPAVFLEAARELEAVFSHELETSSELRLVSRRQKTSHNSWMHNVPRFVRGGAPPLIMHPDDAAKRGLAGGDTCRVETEAGAIDVPVQISDEMMPGTVSLPHGWGHQNAAGLRVARETRAPNFNALTGDGIGALERLSGMARLTGVPVICTRLEPARASGEGEVDSKDG